MTKKNEVATTSQAAAPTPPAETGFDMSGFDVARDVTLPTLTLPVGVPRGIEITGEMYEGKEIKKNGQPSSKAATLVSVINLETGQRAQVVLPAVVESELRDQYPDGDYVGRLFGIQNMGKREGKSYNDVQIVELKRKQD